MVGCVRSTERGQGMLRLGLSVHMLGAADRWVMGCPRQAGCSRGRSTRDKRAEGLDKLPRWPDRPSYQDLVADSFPRQLGRPDVQLLCSACERAVLKANRRATETAGQRPGSWSRPRRRQAARRGRRADPGRRAPAERRHPDCRSTRAVLCAPASRPQPRSAGRNAIVSRLFTSSLSPWRPRAPWRSSSASCIPPRLATPLERGRSGDCAQRAGRRPASRRSPHQRH